MGYWLVAEHHGELDCERGKMDRAGRRRLEQDFGSASSLKLALDAYYNAIRPNVGNDTWLLQATLTFIFPVPGSSGSRP
jgi:hypothetical protein